MAALLAVLTYVSTIAFASPTGVIKPEVLLGGVGPEGTGHLNVSVIGKIFPPPNVLGQEFPQNVEVDCKSCYTRGEMSIGVGGENFGIDYTPAPDFNSSYVQAADFNFEDNWVGFTMESFEAHIELLIQLTPATDSNNKLVIHLLGEPREIPVPDVPGLVVIFDPQIHGVVNVSKAVNFTYGFDLKVPSGSTLLIPVFHVDQFIAVGFNETTMTAIPFQSSSRDLELDFQLSFRAAFSLSLTKILGLDLSDDFAVFADLPKLDVAISQVKNATAACASPSSGERAFPQLTKVAPRIGMDVGLDFLGEEYTPFGYSAPLNSDAPVQCYEYDPKTQLLVTPGSLDKNGRGGKNVALRAFETPILLMLVSILTTAVFI
ncbi:hypothetical protein AURDEDRAFT_121539 [Auricularia subglabra TFB-10046 SS5]|nr:hypothetical protein AURDEDRAFT_121539 [Auricularia subglabra TFB-10046 SS5]